MLARFRRTGLSGEGEAREVFQIGAVATDARSDFRFVAEFSTLVKPTSNPQLSHYAEELTGITNDRLARDGVSLSDALAAFVDLLRWQLVGL